MAAIGADHSQYVAEPVSDDWPSSVFEGPSSENNSDYLRIWRRRHSRCRRHRRRHRHRHRRRHRSRFRRCLTVEFRAIDEWSPTHNPKQLFIQIWITCIYNCNLLYHAITHFLLPKSKWLQQIQNALALTCTRNHSTNHSWTDLLNLLFCIQTATCYCNAPKGISTFYAQYKFDNNKINNYTNNIEK